MLFQGNIGRTKSKSFLLLPEISGRILFHPGMPENAPPHRGPPFRAGCRIWDA
jgi:hypothetical protein